MPEPSTNPEPPKRMTTAEAAALAQKADQNASAALRVAQGADDMVAAMSEKVTDLSTRLQEIANTAGSPPVGDLVHEYVTRDQADSRIHEALEPLHQEVHELRQRGTLTPESKSSLGNVLARLEDAERRLAPLEGDGISVRVAQDLHPTLSELRRRVEALEKTTDVDPVSATLAEDHLSDQIEHQVDRKVAAMFADTGLTPARLAGLAREFDDLRVYVETHGTQWDRAAAITQAAVTVAAPSDGNGAATKVLELMRQVTHIGKEKEANLGKGGRFKFRGVDDAMDAVGHAMRDVGLILGTKILDRETTLTPVSQQGTDNGQAWERTVVWATSVVTARYTFTDPEDGSTHEFEMVGEGRDASDKSTSKATSMALKYGLFQALMIPVTGLDDSDDAPPQQMVNQRAAEQVTAQEAQPAQQPARTEEQLASRVHEALRAIRNLHLVKGGPQAQYNRLVAIMNQVNQEGLMGYSVEGSTLDQHGKAALATLQAFGDSPEHQPSTGDTDYRASYEPPADEGGY
jgi:hypothetical protein